MLNVTCGIIVKDNKILVTQRSETMKLPLKWEFPGGKIHDNETAEECIIREIKEELNLVVTIVKRLEDSPFDYGNNLVINLIPFVLNYVEGEMILAEHKDALWLHKDELMNLDWALADIPVVKNFLAYTND